MGYTLYVATFARAKGDLRWLKVNTSSPSLEVAKARAERYLRRYWNVRVRIEGPDGLVLYLP
jgi:hypothetical protein